MNCKWWVQKYHISYRPGCWTFLKFSLKEPKCVIGSQMNSCSYFYSYKNGSYLLHPTTFHPRTLILNFSSLYFIPSNSSFLFNPLDFSVANSSPTFYPTPCNPFQIICYISYPLNSNSSKWDLLFHTFNLIHNISSSSNHSFDFISLIWSCIFKT